MPWAVEAVAGYVSNIGRYVRVAEHPALRLTRLRHATHRGRGAHRVGGCPYNRAPPDTSRRWAVTHRRSSEASAAIASPISCGSPTRPSAVCALSPSRICASSRMAPPLKSVAVGPGAMALTRILRAPSSTANVRLRTSTAALEAE